VKERHNEQFAIQEFHTIPEKPKVASPIYPGKMLKTIRGKNNKPLGKTM
jgi:hypothetical protein